MTPDSLPLGFLDLCKYGPMGTPQSAARNSIELAAAAEAAGFRRFWLAEHHVENSSVTAPEILLGVIGERTRRIRLGFGGIVIRYYSPWRVGEIVRSLQVLLGPRLDLGLCRGPALVDARVADELVSGNMWELDEPWYERKIVRTLRLLERGDGDARMPVLQPAVDEDCELWILGSSAKSAGAALTLGTSFAIPHFIIRDEERVRDNLMPFVRGRTAGSRQSAILAVSVVGATTTAGAREREDLQVAAGFVPSNVVGSWGEVCSELERLTDATHADEIMITSFDCEAVRRLEIVEELSGRLRLSTPKKLSTGRRAPPGG